MTGEQNIDYETLAHDALRGVVRTVLRRVARSGLPGQHHFYIAFNTNAAGASVSPRLKEKYPEEMTIVLQHQYWNLQVREDEFEVELSFDNIPEKLVIPFNAVKGFLDPHVQFGLQFETVKVDVPVTEPEVAAKPAVAEAALAAAEPAPAAAGAEAGRVVSLDSFRKK